MESGLNCTIQVLKQQTFDELCLGRTCHQMTTCCLTSSARSSFGAPEMRPSPLCHSSYY
uniref:Uncharacterized protein n=1 Tax=Rhizophora mucronata TaxID=61149 RepID=A0A2P2N3K2_RHIMU